MLLFFLQNRFRAMFFFFFFNDTATTEIYTLSLHDALPIFANGGTLYYLQYPHSKEEMESFTPKVKRELNIGPRSEEHTSDLQSRLHLVCRLLLEKKNTKPHGSFARALYHSASDSMRMRAVA